MFAGDANVGKTPVGMFSHTQVFHLLLKETCSTALIAQGFFNRLPCFSSPIFQESMSTFNDGSRKCMIKTHEITSSHCCNCDFT